VGEKKGVEVDLLFNDDKFLFFLTRYMQKPLSVTALNEQIKSLLESTFLHVYIEGEVSRVTYHNSGHLYFTLKDKNSTISCVMFRGNNAKLKFRLEEGMSVLINASLAVYTPRCSYQLN